MTDCAACQHRLAQFAQIAETIQRPSRAGSAWADVAWHSKPPFSEGAPSYAYSSCRRISGLGAVVLAALIVVLFAWSSSSHPARTADWRPASRRRPRGTATTATGASDATSAPTRYQALALPRLAPALPICRSRQNSVSTAPTQAGGGGTGQFTLYQVQMCTADSSPSAVTAFFSTLTSHSWLHSNTFPADGAFSNT